MFKNVIFDLGNVLLEFDPDDYLKNLGYDGIKKDKLKKAIFKTKEWLQLDRGTISRADAVSIWQQKNPDLKEDIQKIMKDWEQMLTVKDESVEVLKKLAAQNYNLYILSNFHTEAFAYVRKKYKFFDYFNGRVISADVNLIKPEPEIYQHLLTKFNLKADETLFIDDSRANVEAAEAEGIKSIHFTGIEKLEQVVECLKI